MTQMAPATEQPTSSAPSQDRSSLAALKLYSDMKLYELPEAMEELADRIADNEGELTPEMEAQLDALAAQWSSKMDGVCTLIRRWLTQSEALSLEIARLQKLVSVREHAAQRLKDYLKSQMERAGMAKSETDLFRVRVQANSAPSIRWNGLSADIPEQFRRTTIELDSRAALEFWKSNGKILPPGFTVNQGTHLRIS